MKSARVFNLLGERLKLFSLHAVLGAFYMLAVDWTRHVRAPKAANQILLRLRPYAEGENVCVCMSVVKSLPGICKVLGSIPVYHKN